MNVGAYRLYDVLLPSMSYETLHHIIIELVQAQVKNQGDEIFLTHSQALIEIIGDILDAMPVPEEYR